MAVESSVADVAGYLSVIRVIKAVKAGVGCQCEEACIMRSPLYKAREYSSDMDLPSSQHTPIRSDHRIPPSFV